MPQTLLDGRIFFAHCSHTPMSMLLEYRAGSLFVNFIFLLAEALEQHWKRHKRMDDVPACMRTLKMF